MTSFGQAITLRCSVFFLLFFVSQITFAQTSYPKLENSWYAFWGWNRGFYTRSDMHFEGNNYSFDLENVEAKDRPSEFSFERYFLPVNVSVPQTNWRLGYFYKGNWGISIGQDHMKYVMVQNQTVVINGTINEAESGYQGEYDHEDIVLEETFLIFEHTDGLNYFNSEITYHNYLKQWQLVDVPVRIRHLEGIGAGALIPRTSSRLFQSERYDRFHLSGFGVSAKVGLNLELGNYFFVQSELKGGYINMQDIRTTQHRADHAEQSFFFLQPDLVIGTRFLIK